MSTPPQDPSADEARIARMIGVGSYQRHLLLCEGPRCCSTTQGAEAWGYLEARLHQLEEAGVLPRTVVIRSRVSCLKICRGGPILVVYPEGVWYRAASPQVIERIVLEHLGRGQVVEEYAFGFNPLQADLGEA